MNTVKPRITKLVVVAIVSVLLAAGVGSMISSSKQQAASAYTSDPIAVGNWNYDQFDSTIVQESQNFGLNPFYVKAVIMVESGFNQWAQSSVVNGACGWTHDLGLMQVNAYCNNIWPASSLYYAWTNIYYGTSELTKAYNQLGDMNLALQAYNIGIPAVENGYRNWAYSDLVDQYAQQFISEHNDFYGGSSSLPSSGSTSGAYTVQAGDYLSLIAGKYGTTYSAIAQSNGIYSPYVIYPGEQLKIPGGGSGVWTYTVQPGDSLYSIGQRYGISSMSIAQENGIYAPYTIYPGEKLAIP